MAACTGTNIRYTIYSLLDETLSPRAMGWLRNARPLAPLRWALLTSSRRPTVQRPICWEGLSFLFEAPITKARKAERRGIENRICRAARRELEAGGSGVDVGASFGFVTSVMAASAGTSGRILSIELDPATAATLSHSVTANRWGRLVTVVNAAADSVHEPPTRVSVDGLVSELGLENIKVLKIDVDGPDFEVLLGARRILREHRPLVIIEISRNGQAIVDLLREHGYHCVDMIGKPIDDRALPPNIFAAYGKAPMVPLGRTSPC